MDNGTSKALEIAAQFGGIDGGHHKMWVIDQMVRALIGCSVIKKTANDCNGVKFEYEAFGESDEYRRFVADANDGADGPQTYSWDTGIAP